MVQIFFIGRLPPDRTDAAAGARGSLYFAMELIDGESLEARLDRGEKLEPEVARRLMIQAAPGLADAHRAGLVHRDVKPGNLLVDRAGALKIADFGLAKPRDKSLSLTRQGEVMGTPLLHGARAGAWASRVDLRADMYALGCTFYHLLAGEPPFDGPNPVAVLSKHLKTPPRPLRELAPAVPLPLAAIIERLMKKEPRAALRRRTTSSPPRSRPPRPRASSTPGFWARHGGR